MSYSVLCMSVSPFAFVCYHIVLIRISGKSYCYLVFLHDLLDPHFLKLTRCPVLRLATRLVCKSIPVWSGAVRLGLHIAVVFLLLCSYTFKETIYILLTLLG